MIIHRLASAIRHQNWSQIITEILIVVIGIFLGLQVTEWNETREDRIEEKVYLSRLIDDLDISIKETQDSIDFQTNLSKRAGITLNALKSCTIRKVDQVDFANGLYHLGKISPVELARTTMDELLSTGKFTIIQNVELRKQLSQMISNYDSHVSYIVDVQGRLASQINYVDSNVAMIIEGPIGGGTDINWQDIEMDFEAICLDQKFYNVIASSANYTWDVVSASVNEIEKYKALKITINEELERITN